MERPAELVTEWIVDVDNLIDGPDRASSFGFFRDAISEGADRAYVSAEKAEGLAIRMRLAKSQDPLVEARKQAILDLFAHAPRKSFGAADYAGQAYSCMNPFHKEAGATSSRCAGQSFL